MLISREIIKKTLEFGNPERVAHSFRPSDFSEAGIEIPNPEGQWKKVSDKQWLRKDEWGNIWKRLDETSKGQIYQGALDHIEKVKVFPLPDFSKMDSYQSAKRIFDQHPDKWNIAYIHGLEFSMARKLRKIDRYFEDLVLEEDKIKILHNRIGELIDIQIKRFQEIGADSIMFFEDWGTQTQLFISPELWREEFKPRYIQHCTYAHNLGLSVIMHSCGKITSIIPDLIESGIDVFQFDQPRIHGIDVLADFQKKNKISYWCPVDIQTTLQTKNESLIRQEADELLDKLWQGRGGFIAGYYGDNPSIGLEPQWQDIASDEFLKKGKADLYRRT